MNANCPDKLKKLTPISRVVNAAAIDAWEEIGKVQQLYFHWAARGLKKLQKESLKSGRRSCLIIVNQNTRTASLPADFDEELFVGYINDYGEKVPIPLKTNLINNNSITTIECEDTCAKCGQDATICNDLTVTEKEEVVVINETTAIKTTVKKLYPDGSYYLETTIPYWNIKDAEINYATTKEFIAAIDLLDCGCINPTLENLETVKNCCYDAYCTHYAGRSPVCDVESGGYKIFEETGLIQFDYKFRHKQVYMEYRGFIPKLNGQLAVPEVAFETLVEYVKAMAVDGKKNVSNPDKAYRWARYNIERKSMLKVMSRFSLDDVIYIISLTPKFDWTAPSWNNFCQVSTSDEVATVSNSALTGCEAMPACSTTASPVRTPFRLAIIVPDGIVSGLPIAGQTTYQNDFLIGALSVDFIIVNNQNESKNLGNFTFNSETGTLDRNPNIWFAGDSLIIDFFKMV